MSLGTDVIYLADVVRMPAGFAGSKSLDERRRRRLAQESVDQAVSIPSVETSSDPDRLQTASGSPIRRRVDESIIPQAPWKIAVLATAIVMAWGGIFWLGTSPWSASVGLQEVFNLQAARLSHLFSTCCLVFSAQLSFFILWYRSRSRKDFGGRYRIWAWAGIFWAITCFVTATQLHLPLAGLAYERWPIECWRAETLFAIGPCAICYVAIFRLLAMEMRTSRVARTLWSLSFCVGIIAAGLHLGLEVLVPEAWQYVIRIACLTGWHGMVAISLLTHARYVAHVNNEATARVMTKRQKLLNWSRERVSELKLFLKAEESVTVDGSTNPQDETESETVSKPKVNNVKPKPTPTKKQSPAPAKRSQKPAPAKKTSSPKTESPSQNRVLGKSIRKDNEQKAPAPHSASATETDSEDEIDYSTLSKKERRRLRKLQKQRSRS